MISAALSAATWYVSLACYKSAHGSSDPNDSTVAACAIGAVTLTCFVPFPLGYFAGLVWAVAVYGFLTLPSARTPVLLGYLAAASVVTRLIVLGVLSVP